MTGIICLIQNYCRKALVYYEGVNSSPFSPKCTRKWPRELSTYENDACAFCNTPK